MGIVLRRRGFSLIEAIVLITIIVLLVVILAPILVPHHGCGSPLAKCQANLKQTTVGLIAYTQDWNGQFPLSDYGYRNDGRPGDARYIDYAVVGDPNATEHITTRHKDLRNLNPYCNLPQTASAESAVFELFFCPGDYDGPDKRCNPATQDGSVKLTDDYRMSSFERHGTSYTIPLVPAEPSGCAVVPLPGVGEWSFANTHRNLMGRRIQESGDPARQVAASDSHCYATSQMPGGEAWREWAWYGAFHGFDEGSPINNMGFLDGHVALIRMQSGSEAWGGPNHEYSFHFVER